MLDDDLLEWVKIAKRQLSREQIESYLNSKNYSSKDIKKALDLAFFSLSGVKAKKKMKNITPLKILLMLIFVIFLAIIGNTLPFYMISGIEVGEYSKYCNMISFDEILKEYCLVRAAFIDENINICGQINDEDQKDMCILFVSNEKSDIKNCGMIDANNEHLYQDQCIGNIAYNTNNISLCTDLLSENSSNGVYSMCISNLAWKLDDISICDNIQDSIDRRDCELKINKKEQKKIISFPICDIIVDQDDRIECISDEILKHHCLNVPSYYLYSSYRNECFQGILESAMNIKMQILRPDLYLE